MKKKTSKKSLKPGIYYASGSMFEVDSSGKKHRRDDITPKTKGTYKRLFK